MPNFNFPSISSFFVAFCIYLTISIGLFFRLAIFKEPALKYTDDKDAFIDVFVYEREISQETKAPPKKDEKKIEETKEEPKKEKIKDTVEEIKKEFIPEKEPVKEVSKEESKKEEVVELKPEKPDFKNLFKDVDVSAKAKEEKKKKEAKKQKKEEKVTITSTEASDTINSLKLAKQSETQKSQSTGIYNETIGAIEKQIQRKWHSYKANTEAKAIVRVLIDQFGNFNYEILEYSHNDEFNKKIKECLDELSRENFPHSKDKSISLDVNMEDKIEQRNI